MLLKIGSNIPFKDSEVEIPDFIKVKKEVTLDYNYKSVELH
jgi:hypothetical protein